ncbi:hypothetical protein [Actinoplanes flavus]|nr:hypothetical protein [Actinoplanes flavus]
MHDGIQLLDGPVRLFHLVRMVDIWIVGVAAMAGFAQLFSP